MTMPRNILRMALTVTVAAVMISSPRYSHAAQSDTERLLRVMTPPLAVIEDKPSPDEMYFDVYYEPSDIIQGNRTGHWSEITGTYGYKHGEIRGYGSVTQYNRFDDKDYAAVIGAYFNLPDSYLHSEIGASWYTNYIYHLQFINEYGHKLFDSVYWQIGYNFRTYDTGNTHIAYPGLIYYFGDSYMAVDYGSIWIEGRGQGNFGNFRGDFAITEFLHLWSGVAVGQWLYDIYALPSSKEFGYILSAGLTLTVYKGVKARVGYSYSTEEPKFIKRSLIFALSAKF